MNVLGPPASETEELECDLFVEGVRRRWGRDFSGYARASLVRRIRAAAGELGEGSISGLLARVMHDESAMARVLALLTVHTTGMFRDPGLYVALRAHVMPALRSYPSVRIWHAGCSTGEEVYSVAIVLHEEGLLPRCRIYATDVSPQVLDRARAAVYPVAAAQEYTRLYQAAGGLGTFSDYYVADEESILITPAIRSGIVFGEHDLSGDASINEFHLILCRNVMIYFGPELQARVHLLLHESLIRLGYLALGRGESIRTSPVRESYASEDEREKLYRRIA